jgi:two-component system NtrC family sensor kinase
MAGPMDPRQQKAVARIFESALRCQKIVQNLLAFARRHPSEKRYLGLNGIVEKTLDLKAYQLRVNNLKVVRDLDPDLPKTMLDFNQVQQVLLNLVNNAQYAVARHRGQGTLTVTSIRRGDAILLTVQDDGAGIPPDTIGKIFDPFFTTKPVGEGTGLGLSVSYGIVKEHGGRIWADSRPGEGTTINIEFPVLPDATAQEQGSAAAPRLEADQPISLLAIDDEAVILDLIVDAFAGNGHRVDTAASAREALDKLERDHYDVVVLDLKMPEMDGRELFERIQEKYPYLAGRVIFASGDTLHPDTQRFLEKSGRPCVEKPFKLEVLSSAIARVVRGDDVRRASGGTA